MVKGGEIPRWMTMVDALVLPADIALIRRLEVIQTNDDQQPVSVGLDGLQA